MSERLHRSHASDSLPLLAAMRFADSAFPGGNVAFSAGLEGLKPCLGHRPTDEDIRQFAEEQLEHRWATADRVALARAWRACGNWEGLADVDCELEAATFCESLRAGARRNGQALLGTHERLATPGASIYRELVNEARAPGMLPCVQGAMLRSQGLDETTALAVSGFGLVSGTLAAAVRLGLIGALRVQAIMPALLETLADILAKPVSADDEICGFTPFIEIAAARQAGLPLRLFAD